MADAQTIQALGGIDLQLRKLVALQQTNSGPSESVVGRGQFVGATSSGQTGGDPGSPVRKQMQVPQLVEFSPSGLKQFVTALTQAMGAGGGGASALTQAKAWGFLKKLFGWASIVAIVVWIVRKWKDIPRYLSSMWKWVRDRVIVAWDAAVAWAYEYFPKQAKWVEDRWTSFKQWFYLHIQNPVQVYWNNLWRRATKYVKETGGDITSNWDRTWAALQLACGDAWGEVLKGWAWVMDVVSKWWTKNVTPWVDRIGIIINTYWEATKEFVATWFVSNVWLNILKGWTWFTTMLRGIGLGVSAQLTAMGDFIVKWVVNKIKQLYWSFENAITGFFIDVWSNFMINMNEMLHTFTIGFNKGLIGLLELLDYLPGIKTQDSIKSLKQVETELIASMAAGEAKAVATNIKRQKANRKASVDSQKIIDDLALSIKAGEPAKNAIDKAIGDAMEGFDKKHKADIEKGKKAGDRFREQTEGLTDILFENNKNLKEASNNTKKANEALAKNQAEFAGSFVHLKNTGVFSPTKPNIENVSDQVRNRTDANEQKLIEQIKADTENAERIDKDGTATGILRQIAASLSNLPKGGGSVGLIPVPSAGGGMGTSSNIATRREGYAS